MNDRLSQLEELLKEDPNDSFLQYGIALELAKKGELQNAISRLEKIISENPDYLGAYYQLGQFHEMQKNNSRAMEIYQQGIILAQKLKNNKTMNELREALQQLEE